MATESQRKIWEKRGALRDALCAEYSYFTHETARSNLKGVRATGLEPRDPGWSRDAALISELGVKQRSMLCLHPVGSSRGVQSTQVGPFMLFAVKASALPAEVTLDWSYSGCWSYAAGLECTQKSETDVLTVVRRYGSIASLGGIVPVDLYVLCKDSEDRGASWCRLKEAQDDVIVVYPTAGQPPCIPECPY
jgi:hypothetical protein